MKTFFILFSILYSFCAFAKETDSFAEQIKNIIIENKVIFSKSMNLPASIIRDDEMFNCYGTLSSNINSNLIGTCYLSDNGSIYILAVTEEITSDFKIIYPSFKYLSLSSEL
jgi:hypothetical protein